MKKVLLTLIALCAVSIYGYTQQWRVKKAPLMTSWSESIDPNNVLPEYPRPVMQRQEWVNLNGVWQFQQAFAGESVPVKKNLAERILVPFPWESALSGVMRQLDSRMAWYRREFTVPQEWDGKKIMLNFGAVDWQAVVYVNGHYVGEHSGGYDPFSFDLSPYLTAKGVQELIVKVYDPTNDKAIAYGKQNNTRFNDPKGYSYSPASGIWQTVWIEPLSHNNIKDFVITPDIDNKQIEVKIEGNTRSNQFYQVSLYEQDKKIAATQWAGAKAHSLSVPDMKLWSVEDPFLYDVVIELKDSTGRTFDSVKSYVGMRKISLINENGVQRLALNNKFVFQMGPLDQGYWPDGIYTAPTDEALRWDIAQTKEFGFNMIRKHIKVEPQRWYYWCDKLGILVWQDMPSTFKERDDMDKIQFESELFHMIRNFRNHPSIVNWVVFNEHWGLYDVERLTEWVIKLDPSRLVTGNSGIDARKPSIDYEVGHIKDNHSYRPPHVPLISSKRATVNGEYGAIGYLLQGHVWDQDGPWVHYNYSGMEAATAEYEKFVGQILGFIQRGLSGAVYTQWTDVENEMNGIYTYDRKRIKLDKERVRKANKSTYVDSTIERGQTDAQHLQ